MAERLAQGTEAAGITALIILWISSTMDWLNDNHLAVISIVTIITGIVTVIAAIYRYRLNKRRVDLYEQEVKKK
jgi:hypothetical protein